MPSFRDLYPDPWLRADIIGNARLRVAIENVRVEKLFNPTTKKHEDKLVASFHKKEKRLVLNKTQSMALAAICGSDDFTRWKGNEIILSVGKAQNGKDTIVISPVSAQSAPRQAEQAPLADAPEEDTSGEDDLWEPNSPGARTDAEDVDFYPPDSGTRPEVHGARPVNNSDGPCPECHAPVGKMHASGCTATASVAEAPGARPQPSGARPEQPSARSENGTPKLSALDAELIGIATRTMPKTVSELIRKTRNADKDSSLKMGDKYLEALVLSLNESIGVDTVADAYALLTALLGYPVNAKNRPGQLVHGFLIKPLRDRNEEMIKPLSVLLAMVKETCINAVTEMGPNG